jgi:hypothetical protein
MSQQDKKDYVHIQPSNNLPNIYHVRTFFDDGIELCPLFEAVVVAKTDKAALKLLVKEDVDSERAFDWMDPNTEVELVGWASGDLKERVIIIAGEI